MYLGHLGLNIEGTGAGGGGWGVEVGVSDMGGAMSVMRGRMRA